MEMINVLNRLTELSKENDSPDVKQAMENTKRMVGDRNAVVVEEHIVENTLPEAIRAGYRNQAGDFTRPETPQEREMLAAKVKDTRKYNRDMMRYATQPGAFDQPDPEKLIPKFRPFQKGAKSALTYNKYKHSNNPAGPSYADSGEGVPIKPGAGKALTVGTIDTKKDTSNLRPTSRWDGRNKLGWNDDPGTVEKFKKNVGYIERPKLKDRENYGAEFDLHEVITKKTPAGEIISDFQKSKNKKFKGKSKV